MRIWRSRKPSLNPDQRAKEAARLIARQYRRRGDLQAQPCESCGGWPVEMHHDDYSLPLSVRWFCRACHRALHEAHGEVLPPPEPPSETRAVLAGLPAQAEAP